MNAVKAELAMYGTNNPAPVPERFKGRAFYDFNAGCFQNQSRDAEKIAYVADPDSPCGYALRTDAASLPNYRLPFEIGFYDQGAKKSVVRKFLAKPQVEPGYNWYELGTVTIPKDGYVYTSRSWTTQLWVNMDFLVGNTYEIWVSAKLSGPLFFPDSAGPDAIWIDRIIFLEPEAP